MYRTEIMHLRTFLDIEHLGDIWESFARCFLQSPEAVYVGVGVGVEGKHPLAGDIGKLPPRTVGEVKHLEGSDWDFSLPSS